MSDDPLKAPQGYPPILREQHVITEHWCEHPGCKRWGSFGHPIGSKTEWFCREHQPGVDKSDD